jgi:serine/threonine protein kinase/Tfp pilus assembly protein PilF
MIGETISHYRILERLGVGGMGEVYKAEDTRLHRQVALKLMLDGLPQAEQVRLRFIREARAASAVSHPNIATIHEIDEVEHNGKRCSFIIMEYVQGRTLKELVGTLSLQETIEILEQAADGLATAHEQGIVHRDIKPSNILVTDAQLVKILDFGVAKFTPIISDSDDTSSLYATEMMKTTPGTVLGTYSYMSPEQARGLDVDSRSDIFSLGVVAYELIAGQLPFTGSSALAVVDAVLHAEPRPLSHFNSQVHPDLDQIIRRLLDKNRDLRYQNLRDFIADLEQAKRNLTNPGQSGYETNISYSTQVLSSGKSELGTNTMRKRDGKSVAVLSFNNVTQQPEDEWLGVGIAETVTADLKNVQGLTVIGRERIFEALRHWNEDLRADFDEKMATRIGREVGARWIIGGAYQRVGDNLRITARAVEIGTGEVVKTVKIDGKMADVFALQDKIVQELSRDLDLNLKSGELEMIQVRETDVIEAFEALSKATSLAYTGTQHGLDEALELLQKAITLDPQYARAYGLMGYALTIKGQFLTQEDLFEKAVEYLNKAIELRPMMSDSYSALGLTFINMDRVDDAIGALKRAKAFAPDDSFVHAALGRAYFIGKGKFKEAAVEFERSLRSDAESRWVTPSLAHCYVYLQNYDRAEELARETIKAQQQYAINHEGIQIIGGFARLGHLHSLRGRYVEAIEELSREVVFLMQSDHALKDRVMIEVGQKMTSAFVRQGKFDDARKCFDKTINAFSERIQKGADDPFTRYYIACACAMMGFKEQAIEHLTKAIDGRRAFNQARARVEVDFENLRDDASFQALLE